MTWRAVARVTAALIIVGSTFTAPEFSVLNSPFSVVRLSAQATAAIPTPPAVPISPRRAAAFGAAIVCGLLLLQYAHRRKAFILLWAAGWLLIAPAMLLIARGWDSVLAARAALGFSQFLGICTATLFFWSGDLYRQTGYVQPKRLRALAIVGLWFVVAPMIGGP